MKNLKFLGVFGLSSLMLFLTGCKDSAHILKCEMTEGNNTSVIEVEFNDEETVAKKVVMDITYDAGDNATDEEIEFTKSLLEEGCTQADNYTCEIKTKGSKITLSLSGSAKNLQFSEGTLEETKLNFEKEGYSCK